MKNIAVYPFCSNTPKFLSDSFFCDLEYIKKSKDLVIFCFYIKSYLCALLISSGKVQNIFGECLTNKGCCFSFCNKKFLVRLGLNIYTKFRKNTSNLNKVIAIDEEELQNEEYQQKKYKNKLFFICSKNKNVKYVTINKKKMCKLIIQID